RTSGGGGTGSPGASATITCSCSGLRLVTGVTSHAPILGFSWLVSDCSKVATRFLGVSWIVFSIGNLFKQFSRGSRVDMFQYVDDPHLTQFVGDARFLDLGKQPRGASLGFRRRILGECALEERLRKWSS